MEKEYAAVESQNQERIVVVKEMELAKRCVRDGKILEDQNLSKEVMEYVQEEVQIELNAEVKLCVSAKSMANQDALVDHLLILG